MRKIIALMLALFLAACNLPRPPAGAGTVPPTDTPVYQNCGFNWATQSLPDLSREVQAAMEKAGLREVTVNAEAYGENCFDSQSNKVVGFSTLETDFKVSMEVADLRDTERLGKLLEQILVVLDQFPTGSTPGPQPGSIGVRFTAGNQEMNLWFLVQDEIAARELGLHGAELLKRLQKK